MRKLLSTLALVGLSGVAFAQSQQSHVPLSIQCNPNNVYAFDQDCLTFPTGFPVSANQMTFGNLNVNDAVPSTSNTWIYGAPTLSGTGVFTTSPVLPASRWAPWWLTINDIANFPNSGVGGTGILEMQEIYDSLNAGWNGFRGGLEVQEFVKAAPLWSPLTGGGNNSGATAPTSSPSTNLNAIKDFINVNVNMGGIAGSSLGANGNLFSFNPSIKLEAAATSIQYVGAEFDVNALPGSSAIEKHGLVIALAGICNSQPCASEVSGQSLDEEAMSFTTGDNYGSSWWPDLINAGMTEHASPSNYQTTYIGARRRYLGGQTQMATPTFRYGTDFTHAYFSIPTSTGAVTVTGASAASGLATLTFSAQTINVTGASGNGTTATLTYSSASPYPVRGSYIVVSGITPTGYNTTGAYVVSSTPTSVTYYNGTTGMYTSGGTIAMVPQIGGGIVVSGVGSGYDCNSGAGGIPLGCFVVESTSTSVSYLSSTASGTPSSGSFTVTTPQGNVHQSAGWAIDPVGNMYGNSVTTSATGIASATATISSINIEPFSGYLGGNLVGLLHANINIDAPNGATPPTISAVNYQLNSAMLIQNATATATFTGVLSTSGGPSVLTASSVTGTITPLMTITGTGIANHTIITAYGTGSGGAGTYVTNNIQNVSSESMTGTAPSGISTIGTDIGCSNGDTLILSNGTPVTATFTGAISGTTLTTSGPSGTIAIGMTVTGTSVTAGTLITAGSGSSWTVNNSQTVGSESMTGTSNGVITLTVSGGSVTSAAVTYPGNYTAGPGTTPTWTGGHCTTQPNLALGFGITSITLTGGSGYVANPPPEVWVSGFATTINTPPKLTAVMTPTAVPVAVSGGEMSTGTTFTVSGCGTGGSLTGGAAAGSFTVGTGAGSCTFVIMPGTTAKHGWIMNLDDATTAHAQHCINSATASQTTGTAICGSTVGSSDQIVFSMTAY